MPRFLLRFPFGLALIACVFAGLKAFSPGFGPKAPLPREAAVTLLAPPGLGVLELGAAL